MLALTFFLLLDGRGMVERGTGRLPSPQRERARRIATRIAGVVKAYVTVNLVLAIAAGLLHLGRSSCSASIWRCRSGCWSPSSTWCR